MVWRLWFFFHFCCFLLVSCRPPPVAVDAGAQRDTIAAKMRAEDYASVRTLLLETLQANPRLEGAIEMVSVYELLCGGHEFD